MDAATPPGAAVARPETSVPADAGNDEIDETPSANTADNVF
jgi:hypothetical protein